MIRRRRVSTCHLADPELLPHVLVSRQESDRFTACGRGSGQCKLNSFDKYAAKSCESDPWNKCAGCILRCNKATLAVLSQFTEYFMTTKQLTKGNRTR